MNFKLTKKTFYWLKSAIWIAYFLFLINTFIVIKNYDIIFGVLLCGVLLELTLIRFINHWYRLEQPRLLDWFRLVTFVSIVLNYLSLTHILDESGFILVNNVVFTDSSYALPTLFVILVGLIALDLSERIVLLSYKVDKVKLKKKQVVKTRVKRKALFIVFGVFTIFLQAYLQYKGFVGYGTYTEYTLSSFSYVIQISGIVSSFILAILAYLKYVNKGISKYLNVLFYVFLIFQLIFGFLSGMKEEIITPIIIVLIPYLIGGNIIPKKIVSFGILFIVLLYPINNNYRKVLNDDLGFSKKEAFQIGVLKTLDQGLLESFTSGSESLQSRLSFFPIMMYSVENADKWSNYKYFDRYIYLPFGWFMPRFLLPDKPVSDTGAELYYMTTGRKTNSITPTTFGWAYLEGGYIFVFISFLLFGLIISFFQRNLNSHTIFNYILYIVVLTTLLKVEADIYFRISGLFQTLLIGYIINMLFFKQLKN